MRNYPSDVDVEEKDQLRIPSLKKIFTAFPFARYGIKAIWKPQWFDSFRRASIDVNQFKTHCPREPQTIPSTKYLITLRQIWRTDSLYRRTIFNHYPILLPPSFFICFLSYVSRGGSWWSRFRLRSRWNREVITFCRYRVIFRELRHYAPQISVRKFISEERNLFAKSPYGSMLCVFVAWSLYTLLA